MKMKVRQMVGMGVLTAMVVVLVYTLGYIKIAGATINPVLVPVVVGAALYGWKAGAWLGFVSAFAFLISGAVNDYLSVNFVGTVVTVLIKGVTSGLIAGLVYKFISKWNSWVAVFAAAVVCPVVNTGLYLLGCWLFFMPAIRDWSIAENYESVVAYMFLFLAGTNFLIELATNVVLAPTIERLVRIGRKGDM